MRKLLFGTQTWDLQTLAAVAFLLTMLALLASYMLLGDMYLSSNSGYLLP
jgi:hypothetical protein